MELVSSGVVLAKVESTYGTDPVPGDTNAIVAANISYTPTAEKRARNASGPSMSPWAHVMGQRHAEISFDVDLRGYGSAYSSSNLPEVDPLLRACGFSSTLDVSVPGSEFVTYDPASRDHESCTIYFYDASMLYKITGCRGEVSFTMEDGNLGIAKFSFQGLFAKPTDQALITPVWQPDVTPPAFLSAGFTLGGHSAVISKLDLKAGVSLAQRMDANSANGISEIFIGGRTPGGTVDPEMELVATKDFFTEWLDGTPQAIAATLGGTQYNRVKFSAPKAQYDSLAHGNRNDIRTLDIPFECKRDTGDDELVITFD